MGLKRTNYKSSKVAMMIKLSSSSLNDDTSLDLIESDESNSISSDDEVKIN